MLALRDSYLKQEMREFESSVLLVSGLVPMKVVFLWLDQLSWHGFLPFCQLRVTFHCALHFIYTLAEARFPCRLLNHLGMAFFQMLAGSWFLCGLLNSLGMRQLLRHQLRAQFLQPAVSICWFWVATKREGLSFKPPQVFFFGIVWGEIKLVLREKETLG